MAKKKKKSSSKVSPYERKILSGYSKIKERKAEEKYKKLSEDDIKRKAKYIKARQQIERVGRKIERALQKRVVSRRILRPSQTTLTIKSRPPAEYVSRFFKDEFNEAKKEMFKWYSQRVIFLRRVEERNEK